MKLGVHAGKLQEDEGGEVPRAERAPSEPVEIGIFDAAGKALYRRKHRLAAGDQELEIEVEGRPARAGVDPEVTLLDRNPDDNWVYVETGSVALAR